MFGQIDTSSDTRVRELRRCGKCTQPSVTVVHVTQHYSRGLPTGRTYDHRCGACNVTFRSISTWRALTQYFGAAVIVSFGFSLFGLFLGALMQYGLDVVHADGSRWGTWLFGLALLLLGVAWAGWTTWLVARLMILNPVVSTR